MVRTCSLLIAMSVAGFAGTWSGQLVDSRSYASQANNVSADASYGSRDMAEEVRSCLVNAKTRKFAVVLDDWSTFRFAPAGNSRVAEMVVQAYKRMAYRATVMGSANAKRRTVSASSLSLKKVVAPK